MEILRLSKAKTPIGIFIKKNYKTKNFTKNLEKFIAENQNDAIYFQTVSALLSPFIKTEINLPYTKAKKYEHILPKIIFQKIKTGILSFPYHFFMENIYGTKNEIFKKLKKYSFGKVVKRDCVIIKPHPKLPKYCFQNENEFEINVLTDYFTETERMRARRVDTSKSPIELWNNFGYVKFLCERLIKAEKDFTTFNLREEIYLTAKECSQFKTTTAISCYKLFKAKKILDISAGWGDRLLAAVAYNCEYLACDPNFDLKAGHKKIMKLNPGNHRVIYEPFEKADLGDYKPDLVFTSPPYFDYEIYSNKGEQSIKNFSSFDAWLVNFLFFCLKKSFDVLQEKKFMAIHIADTYLYSFVEKMCLFCTSFIKNCSYLTAIIICGNKRDVPIWVFKKVKGPNNSEEFKQKYPDIFEKCRQSFQN